MNKKWLTIEKTAGVIITVWGMVTLYSVSSNIYSMVSTGFAQTLAASYLQIFQKNHLSIVVSIVSIFGGILLLYGDKPGWILSVTGSCLFAVILFMSATDNKNDATQTARFFYQSYSVMAIIFAVITILLLQKPFREKYKPTTKNWRIIGLILLIAIIDKILL